MINYTVQKILGDKNIQEQKYDLYVNLGALNPNINYLFQDQVSAFQKMHLKFFTILAELHWFSTANVYNIAEAAAIILLNLTG